MSFIHPIIYYNNLIISIIMALVEHDAALLIERINNNKPIINKKIEYYIICIYI